jgi:hypothetical protein
MLGNMLLIILSILLAGTDSATKNIPPWAGEALTLVVTLVLAWVKKQIDMKKIRRKHRKEVQDALMTPPPGKSEA